jgi:hypothetical protein
LASCATPVKMQQEELLNKSICCKSLGDFNYRKVDLIKGLSLKFNNKSPVYDFGDGKTYVSAIEITPDIRNNYISVESHFNGSLIGQYFDPIFLVLDENFEGLEVFSLKLRFLDANLFTNPNAHMAGSFKLIEGAKYIVVFTGHFKSNAPVADIAPSMSMVMIGNTPTAFMNDGSSIKLERSPTGVVKLKLAKGK